MPKTTVTSILYPLAERWRIFPAPHGGSARAPPRRDHATTRRFGGPMRDSSVAGSMGFCPNAWTSVRPIAMMLMIALVALTTGIPLARAVDSDGDGVDDALDCRPTDNTTWAVSPEARSLVLTGGANTSFSWLPPTPAPSTPAARVFDVLRNNGPASWASAVCLLSNTISTSAPSLDATIPSNVYFYLVRAKTACGGALGQNSSGVPTNGTNCSLAEGQACAVGAYCN